MKLDSERRGVRGYSGGWGGILRALDGWATGRKRERGGLGAGVKEMVIIL